jgi:hypothetical protein
VDVKFLERMHARSRAEDFLCNDKLRESENTGIPRTYNFEAADPR